MEISLNRAAPRGCLARMHLIYVYVVYISVGRVNKGDFGENIPFKYFVFNRIISCYGRDK